MKLKIKIVTLIIFLFSMKLYGQNNTLKIFVIPTPPGLNILSLVYERKITEHSACDLSTHLLYSHQMGGDASFRIFSIIPSYKYYLISEKKIINNFWISPYLMFSRHSSGSYDTWSDANVYSIGTSTGRRFSLTKRKRLVLDIGCGISYGKKIYTYYKEWILDKGGDEILDTIWTKESDQIIIPRPIIHVGYKF